MASVVTSDPGSPAEPPSRGSAFADAVVGAVTRFPDLTRVLVAIAAGASAETLPSASPLVHSLTVVAVSIAAYIGWLYATTPALPERMLSQRTPLVVRSAIRIAGARVAAFDGQVRDPKRPRSLRSGLVTFEVDLDNLDQTQVQRAAVILGATNQASISPTPPASR